jgi:RNA polymerase sigma factor (sigma-70 family)
MDAVSMHLHLVRPIVLRRTGRLDPEMVSTGYMALVLAAAEWDSSRGGDFKKYAQWRIGNATVDRIRSESYRDHQPLGEDPPASPEELDIALRLDIQAALERLPPRQRLLLHLRFWQGFTMAEAAREAGCSVFAAKRASAAAVTALRSTLA